MKWTTVKNFPDYEITVVNSLGIIRNKKTLKVLSQSLSSHGYYQVNIANKSRRVHRLIAETLIDNPHNLETVNHDNGNKLDNSLNNLKWETRVGNSKHSREVLGHKSIPYSKNPKQHHLIGRKGFASNKGKSIIMENDKGEEIVYGSAYEAANKLFGNSELGKYIRQAIKRSTSYKGLKFRDNEPTS